MPETDRLFWRALPRQRWQSCQLWESKMFHSAYRGASIYRAIEPGYRLRWTALCFGTRLASDTLAGIRRAIREDSSQWCFRR